MPRSFDGQRRPANRLENDTVILGGLTISFHRTVRVPDSKKISQLPPDLGKFPLFQVKDYAGKLPPEMSMKGGLFMPMYQKEAMWINFSTDSPMDRYAIKIYVGAVNAVSGEPAVETAATALRRRQKLAQGQSVQDYVVVPNQKWLDGIATAAGEVRQFVAMEMGSGHSIEAQITGEEVVGGLQFEITPYAPYREVERCLKEEREVRTKGIAEAKGVAEMNLGAGGRIEQSIVQDPFGRREWLERDTSTFNVQILNTMSFSEVTGRPAPVSPIDAATYVSLGLPYFSIDEPKSDVAGDFEGIKPVPEDDKAGGVAGAKSSAKKDKVKEKVAVPSLATILFGSPKKTKKTKKEKKPKEKEVKKPEPMVPPPPHVPANVTIGSDFFNPGGPRMGFRSVREIEDRLREVRSVAF